MKLRNKKTGEITEGAVWIETRLHTKPFDCSSIADLVEFWEDYKPAEPLIKDEKIRKAVRAWAEANDYGSEEIYEFVDFSTGWKSWSLDHKGNGDDNEIHFNGGIDFDKVEHQGYYTIEELCGEEEE